MLSFDDLTSVDPLKWKLIFFTPLVTWASKPAVQLMFLIFTSRTFSLSIVKALSFTSCIVIKSDQIRSVAQSCPTLCYPMNRSTPGLPVHHQLPKFTQTHVHRVSDAIQPSHPLSSPSPPAPNPSQHQSPFQ